MSAPGTRNGVGLLLFLSPVPGPRNLGWYLVRWYMNDHPVTEAPGRLLVDGGPCTSSLPSLLLYQSKSPVKGVSSVSTADSGPAGVSGSSLIVAPQTQMSGDVRLFTVSLETYMPSAVFARACISSFLECVTMWIRRGHM